MEIETLDIEGIAVVAPAGRIDSNTAAEAEAAIMPLFATARAIVIDFGKLSYISSAGLRVLLIAAKASKSRNVPLVLCGLSKPVHDVLRMGNFTKLFAIHEDRTRAVLALARPAG
ncbi:MAG: STAS domain-containing protein [Rhizobiaceae bacterium]|nr:STAS domain-containing protein [Rhizobiaceae bacterium]